MPRAHVTPMRCCRPLTALLLLVGAPPSRASADPGAGLDEILGRVSEPDPFTIPARNGLWLGRVDPAGGTRWAWVGADGRARWVRTLPCPTSSTTEWTYTVGRDSLLCAEGSTVSAYDRVTGATSWSVATGGTVEDVRGAGGRAVVDLPGELAILDIRTGKQLSRFPLDNVMLGPDGTDSVGAFLVIVRNNDSDQQRELARLDLEAPAGYADKPKWVWKTDIRRAKGPPMFLGTDGGPRRIGRVERPPVRSGRGLWTVGADDEAWIWDLQTGGLAGTRSLDTLPAFMPGPERGLWVMGLLPGRHTLAGVSGPELVVDWEVAWPLRSGGDITAVRHTTQYATVYNEQEWATVRLGDGARVRSGQAPPGGRVLTAIPLEDTTLVGLVAAERRTLESHAHEWAYPPEPPRPPPTSSTWLRPGTQLVYWLATYELPSAGRAGGWGKDRLVIEVEAVEPDLRLKWAVDGGQSGAVTMPRETVRSSVEHYVDWQYQALPFFRESSTVMLLSRRIFAEIREGGTAVQRVVNGPERTLTYAGRTRRHATLADGPDDTEFELLDLPAHRVDLDGEKYFEVADSEEWPVILQAVEHQFAYELRGVILPP